MNTSKNKSPKRTYKKPAPKKALSELSDLHKEAIFNHEDCRKVFEERIQDVKLGVTPNSARVIAEFAKLLPELSDSNLNLSDVDGEYEQLISIVDGHFASNDVYPVTPGIFILMCNQIRKSPAKLYCDGLGDRLSTFTACKEVLKAVKGLSEPVRDQCIAEFYENATDEQLLDINITVRHRENPQGQGMPGNQGLPQFRG